MTTYVRNIFIPPIRVTAYGAQYMGLGYKDNKELKKRKS